ncbi:group II intron reverse transcriptase/maturase [Pararhizobium sp. LjRoot238]|uniref:group II intron reverse transcriptase/maturase n=1 Tax=Pararhizobium sp. LjRoot238 TaxID=3342293 RepID=UPI003ECF3DBA
MTSTDTTDKPFRIDKRLVHEAYKAVKSNGGAAGVDGQTIEQFEADLGRNLYRIWNRMSSGSYFPPPVRAVPIPKKTGGQRILGVPTVSDRIAQMVVKRLIEPELDQIFRPDSYGYRPGKSALDAVGVTRQRCWKYDWVLEFDIKGLFDNISHELLLKAVRKHVKCKWALLYIERWLTAPLEQDGQRIERDRGTPQGGVVSPILSNLFLHYAFDLWMDRTYPDLPWCRYADDGLVHCRSEREAEAIKAALQARLAECQLEMHPTKTKIVYCKDGNRKRNHKNVKFDFLGYCFRPRRARNARTHKMFCNFSPGVSAVALKAMRKTIRDLDIRRQTSVAMTEIARQLNPLLRGWIAYYGRYTASALGPFLRYVNQTLQAWMMRKFKRFKGRKTKAGTFLIRLKRECPNLFVHWKLGRTGTLA